MLKMPVCFWGRSPRGSLEIDTRTHVAGELASLLRGVPVMTGATPSLGWNTKTGRYVLTLKDSERVQVIEFEPQHRRVTSLRTELNGRELYAIKLGQYSGTGDAIIPLRIRFVVPKQELSIDMTVKDHTLDPELPAGAFTLTIAARHCGGATLSNA